MLSTFPKNIALCVFPEGFLIIVQYLLYSDEGEEESVHVTAKEIFWLFDM